MSRSDRRARIRTVHADPETVAAALRPDDAASMTTRAEGDAVVTEISRDRTGGLRSTVDDYLVNVRVADRVARAAAALDGDAGTRTDERTSDTDTHDT